MFQPFFDAKMPLITFCRPVQKRLKTTHAYTQALTHRSCCKSTERCLCRFSHNMHNVDLLLSRLSFLYSQSIIYVASDMVRM